MVPQGHDVLLDEPDVRSRFTRLMAWSSGVNDDASRGATGSAFSGAGSVCLSDLFMFSYKMSDGYHK